ncbi:MAG: hypothetical protein WED04_07260 [Promethearchaeati archaeon SRVP18_Atabeyarchaeia-1]
MAAFANSRIIAEVETVLVNMNPLLASMSDVEKEIFEIWKEYEPALAFGNGLEEYAGRMFIPTESNINEMGNKIQSILKKTREKNQRKLLESMGVMLEFQEPYKVLSVARDIFFAHIVKEGINSKHLMSLADDAEKAIAASRERLAGKKWPTEVKIVTCQCSGELKGILATIREETNDQGLKDRIDRLVEAVDDYRKVFNVEGIVEGDFTEVFPILEKLGGDLGHKRIYPQILKYGFDFYETPRQIEEKALKQLRKELPLFKEIVQKLAKVYGCEPTYEQVAKAMNERTAIPKAKTVEFVNEMRKKLLPVLAKHLVRITPKYDTRVIETPPYLLNFITTAATSAFDLLTDKPFSIFFVTTDEKRSPASGAADIIQTIVHEETGHCVHYQNSAAGFGAKPSPADLMDSYLSYAVSDGISFHREYEFLGLLKKLAGMDEGSLSNEEKGFLDAMKGKRGISESLLENEFVLMQWRLVRFLRAIFDSRVNTGKQTIIEFVKWASKTTGLAEKLIFNQTWIFLDRIGYAPVYFIVGDALRALQEKAIKKGVNVIDFNTYATSIGYGARTVFEERLEDYTREHGTKK